MTPWVFTCRLIDHALAELADRVETMPAAAFLDQHEAVHAEVRSLTIDLVAMVHEREFWRRWPEGRDD